MRTPLQYKIRAPPTPQACGMLWTSSEGREERLKRLRAGLKTYADAGVYGRLTYSFVGSLLSLGAVGGIDEDVGPELLPANNRAEVLSETFDALYQQVCYCWWGAMGGSPEEKRTLPHAGLCRCAASS